MGRRGWITNPASQQYKQLEHVVSKMRGDFTSRDMMNFMQDRWDTEGLAKLLPSATTGEPVMQKRGSRSKAIPYLGSYNSIRALK